MSSENPTQRLRDIVDHMRHDLLRYGLRRSSWKAYGSS